MKEVDIQKIVSYIEKLVGIPSPTGFTDRITACLEKHAGDCGISCGKTKKGSLFYRFDGTDPSPAKIMLAAHVDTLGAMVTKVEEKGLRFASIGSFPLLNVIGDYCTIHTYDGRSFEGTILPDNPASHVNGNLSDTKPEKDNLFIRPDLDPQVNPAEIFQVGNFISFDPRFKEVNGFIKSRHLDDKASTAILLYLADLINQKAPVNDIYLYFNTTEETAQGISGLTDLALDELVIVDMGVVGDGCEGTEFDVSLCSMDSSGPYHYGLTRKLATIAESAGIPYKNDVFPHYSSDGSTFLRAGHDVKTALVGPGVGASHGYERTHVRALESTARLLLSYINQ